MKGYASSNPQVKMAEPSRTPKYQKSRRHDKRRRFSFLVSLTPDTWHLWCHNLILLRHHACHERQKWCDIQPAHVLQVSNQAHLACYKCLACCKCLAYCKWAIKLTLLATSEQSSSLCFNTSNLTKDKAVKPSWSNWSTFGLLLLLLFLFLPTLPPWEKELAFSMGLFWVILWKIDGA